MDIKTRTAMTPKGEINIYTLTNDCGMTVELSELGAGILSIIVPDREGNPVDVALGYADPAAYLYDGPCMGKTPGRYANRIAGGKFILDEKEFTLPINNGPNHLHGGPEGFQNQVWKTVYYNEDQVIFSLLSPDGDMGYPGNLVVSVAYLLWEEENRLDINYTALCDDITPLNLTNHVYFNLNGHDSGSCLDHELWLACQEYLPTDETLIPNTPQPVSVEGTPMDFRTPKPLGRDIREDFPALRYGKGYDSYWWRGYGDELDREHPEMYFPIATLTAPKTGIRLDVSTNQFGIQVYTGNWLSGCPTGKGGAKYEDYAGVALECSNMPDGPNHHNGFHEPVYPYQHEISFTFSTL